MRATAVVIVSCAGLSLGAHAATSKGNLDACTDFSKYAEVIAAAKDSQAKCAADCGVTLEEFQTRVNETVAEIDIYSKSANCATLHKSIQKAFGAVQPPCAVETHPKVISTTDLAAMTFEQWVTFLKAKATDAASTSSSHSDNKSTPAAPNDKPATVTTTPTASKPSAVSGAPVVALGLISIAIMAIAAL
ncbi:hypothetical protein ACHHYP_20430 [Achlya hypogyna]|uniref:Secreted protein n=1 Tax=Achlya hypogyna TaxID=1202772 RepID=A0A1V9YNA0_ACHHY|nr:hypothetical protein ACHHYP_20430 [Achlya hypogyna]